MTDHLEMLKRWCHVCGHPRHHCENRGKTLVPPPRITYGPYSDTPSWPLRVSRALRRILR